jgi:hypothetical protein
MQTVIGGIAELERELIRARTGEVGRERVSAACNSSELLGGALRRAERYGTMVNEGVSLRVREGKEIVVTFTYVCVERLSDRHQIEALGPSGGNVHHRQSLDERPERSANPHLSLLGAA